MKCILSDYAGVISLPQDEGVIREMSIICGVTLTEFESAYWHHREAYDQGIIIGPEYWVKSFPNSDLSDEKIKHLIQKDCESWRRLNKETQKWFEELKESGHRMNLFSNMPAELTVALKRNIPWLRIFEESFFSSEMGLSKPHLKSFHLVLKRLRLKPDEILFIDDREENIEGAKKAGLKTLHFKDVLDARSQFQKLKMHD